MRKAAEQWRIGLGALTGTLTTIAILKGPTTFRELTFESRLWVVLALMVAFVFLLAGSWCAMRAALPHLGSTYDSGDDLRRWTDAEATRSVKFLLFAQIFTPLALLFLALGTGISWLDSGESPKTLLAVVLADGSKMCGTAQGIKDGEFDLLLDTKTSQKVHLRFADVRSLTVGKC